MDLHQSVRAFVSVARLQSFSAAADTEGSSQPVMSRRVAALETMTGGLLLDRTSKRVRLTPLGTAVLGPAQQLLDAESAFVDAARAHHAGVVRLLVPRDLDPARWAAAVLTSRAQGHEVEISEAAPADRDERIAGGLVDAALMRGPGRQPSWLVPLGVGSAPEDDGVLRLLRPVRADRGRHVALLVTEEDSGLERLDLLRRAIARLGLGAVQVSQATNLLSALADVAAGEARVLCSQDQAVRWGLHWNAAPELDADRRYHLEARGSAAIPAVHDSLVSAVGQVLGRPSVPPSGPTPRQAQRHTRGSSVPS